MSGFDADTVRWFMARSLASCALAAGSVLAGPMMSEAGVSPRDYQRMVEQLSEAVESRRVVSAQTDSYDVVFRRDPMRPIIDPQGDVAMPQALRDGLSVQEILFAEQRPLAVSDGDVFASGETVGPYTILGIRSDGLVAQRGNQMLFIPADQPSMTSTALRPSPTARPIESPLAATGIAASAPEVPERLVPVRPFDLMSETNPDAVRPAPARRDDQSL